MIPADIGTALFVLLFLAVAYLVLRWIGPKLAAMRVQHWPQNDEIDSGDQGGHPTAGQKIIAGLEDTVAHARGEPGRAKVTHYPRKEGD